MDKKKKDVFAKADKVAARLGSTTKGNGGGKKAAKAKRTVKPKKIAGSWGVQVKKTF